MMEVFSNLPDQLQEEAWELKKLELVDDWFESNLHENGRELPNWCEEELLTLLDSANGTKLMDMAKSHYKEEED